MTDETCSHQWGEAEECETPFGTFQSPVCRHCGAVKMVEDQRAFRRVQEQRLARPVNFPAPVAATDAPRSAPGAGRPASAVAGNQPPAGVRVHRHQAEFFTDV